MSTITEQTVETYGIENWGAGYFGVNRKGNLVVISPDGDHVTADVDSTKEGDVAGHSARQKRVDASLWHSSTSAALMRSRSLAFR